MNAEVKRMKEEGRARPVLQSDAVAPARHSRESGNPVSLVSAEPAAQVSPGAVPYAESWTRTTLGTLAGGRGKTINPAKTPHRKFELYSVPSFPRGKPETVTGEAIGSSKQSVEPRTVLLSKINPRINRAWVVGNFTEHQKIASTEWITFPPSQEVMPEFLCYFLQQNAVRDFLARNASGVGGSLMRVKPATLRDFPFAYPRVEEQRRIVAEIEKQFTRLDAGVAALRRVRANLKRYRAAVLKAACEGRLVPTEAELAKVEGRTYETGEQLLARILADRRENWHGRGKYKEPAALDTTNLPPLPEGWAWATVEQLNLAGRPCAYGVLQPGDDVEGGVPFVRVGDISDGKVEQSNLKRITPSIAAKYPRTKLQGGELVITLVGAIGRAAIIPASLEGGNVARAVGVVPLALELDRHWVEIWFRNPQKVTEMTARSHEVARKTLNLEDVRAASVALPPVAEQIRIVAEVERRLSVIEELEAAVTANLQRATRLHQSILQRAFGDTVRLNSQ